MGLHLHLDQQEVQIFGDHAKTVGMAAHFRRVRAARGSANTLGVRTAKCVFSVYDIVGLLCIYINIYMSLYSPV